VYKEDAMIPGSMGDAVHLIGWVIRLQNLTCSFHHSSTEGKKQMNFPIIMVWKWMEKGMV